MPDFDHQSVLLQECLSLLEPKLGDRVADVTAGGGGHSAALLSAIGEGGRLLCVDRDAVAVSHLRTRFADVSQQVVVVQGAFSELPEILREHGFDKLNCVIADLGVSSPQLDVAQRGFSWREEGPLDMRMNRDVGYTALELISSSSEQQLADIIYKYGEERRSRPIARSILRALADGQLHTTSDLRRAVVRVTGPKKGRIDPATRTFQALRIAVNDELGELRALLDYLPEVLADEGTVAIIAFHSLEDRMVKHTFRDDPRLTALSKRPIVASEEEQRDNPRSRSAKLRGARRVARIAEAA